ncbi:MAG: anti-sigma factor antagonist [Pseudonocardiaceae bacterium]|nr:MAG: anti-sigma factor antagonist [Pseudonocardiaceae bacterium]
MTTTPTGDTTGGGAIGGGAIGGGTDGGAGGGIVEVVLTGEFDIATYERAEQQVEQAEQAAPELLVIDLSRLTFMDSSGVRLVLLARDRADAARRRLAVRLGVGPAQRVFDSLGLTSKVEVLPSPPAVPAAAPPADESTPEPAAGAAPGPSATLG